MGTDMTNTWKEWQGRTVDGKFVLGTYLGGSEGSAVFRTRLSAGSTASTSTNEADAAPEVAIKLVVADGAEAESPLRRWEAATRLSHPNLIRIFTTGRCAVDGRELVYEVEEFAEENLGQIIPDRALTPEEAQGTLLPVLAALEYLHGQGLVHGAIRPSNILGVQDQVKLSADNLRPAGEVPPAIAPYDAPEILTAGISPASDVWSLGMTLVEILTQHIPAWDPARMRPPDIASGVPEPFRGIAQRCLQLDSAKRCGPREIADWLKDGRVPGTTGERPLEGRPPDRIEESREVQRISAATPNRAAVDAPPRSAKKTAKGPYLLVLAAIIVIAVFFVLRSRPTSAPSQAQAPSSSQTAPPQASSPPASQTTGDTSPAPVQPPPPQAPVNSARSSAPQKPAADEIVERAEPQVAPSARRTITGRIKVRVRVEVNAAGNVTEAKIKQAGSSKYFARLALEAARRWKFAPAPDANRRAWTLLFAFTHARTEMSAARSR